MVGMSVSVNSRVWLAFALAQIGRFGEGFVIVEQAIERANALAHAYSVFHAYWAQADLFLAAGEHERAQKAIARLWQVVKEGDAPRLADNVSGLAGHAHALAGQTDEAIRLLEGALAPKRRNAFNLHRDMLYLSDAYVRANRLPDALVTAQRALEATRRCGEQGREAQALRLIAEVHTVRGDSDEGYERNREALALGTELGMRPLVAHCHAGLAKLYERTGKPEQAQEHILTATTMYREMDMRYWLEKAAAEAATE